MTHSIMTSTSLLIQCSIRWRLPWLVVITTGNKFIVFTSALWLGMLRKCSPRSISALHMLSRFQSLKTSIFVPSLNFLKLSFRIESLYLLLSVISSWWHLDINLLCWLILLCSSEWSKTDLSWLMKIVMRIESISHILSLQVVEVECRSSLIRLSDQFSLPRTKFSLLFPQISYLLW